MLASIERILEVRRHPNADRLDIVKVLGYQCIVPTRAHRVNALVVLIQPDTVLPEAEWSNFYRKASKTRVRAVKLRDQWSFGIVESLSILPEGLEVFEGLEVSAELGIEKYQPIVPIELSALGYLPHSIPKTDEERWQNLDLSDKWGQLVDVTLKIDGASFTAYCMNGNFGVCSRTLELYTNRHNAYTAHIGKYSLEEKLKRYCRTHSVNIALRGESYGEGIQSSSLNPHSKLEKGLAFFSVYLIDEMRYAGLYDEHSVDNVCRELDLPKVPVINSKVELTPELIELYDEGIISLGYTLENGELTDCLPFEGVVIQGYDFSFKIINKHYDSHK